MSDEVVKAAASDELRLMIPLGMVKKPLTAIRHRCRESCFVTDIALCCTQTLRCPGRAFGLQEFKTSQRATVAPRATRGWGRVALVLISLWRARRQGGLVLGTLPHPRRPFASSHQHRLILVPPHRRTSRSWSCYMSSRQFTVGQKPGPLPSAFSQTFAPVLMPQDAHCG